MRTAFISVCIPLLFLVIAMPHAAAQEKILEKSGKKPQWVNSVEKGYIIEMGKGLTADEARDKAMERVRESIIRSVAEQITATSAQSTVETRTGNKYQVSGDYASAILTRTAKMPFVKGISASRAEAFYWDKISDKKSGSVWVNYHIKYPFSEAELGMIIMDFEKDQKEKEMAVMDICQVADNSSNLDEIAQKYRELLSLLPQLEDPVKGEAMLCLAKYQGLLKSFSLQALSSSPGHLAYLLTSGGRTYRYTAKPIFKSNCAGSFILITSADTNKITYDFNGCYESQVNKISVEYHFEDISIKNDFTIDINAGKVEFAIIDGFRMTEDDGDSLYIRQCTLGFSINSKYATDFSISRIRLDFSGTNPVIFDGPDIKVRGKGIHSLSVSGNTFIKRATFTSRQGMADLVSGTIEYLNLLTGVSGVLKFYSEKTDIRLLQK